MSVLGVGDAQKRNVGGWLWWIFHKQKERKREGPPQSYGIRFGCCHMNADFVILCSCHWASLLIQLFFKQSFGDDMVRFTWWEKNMSGNFSFLHSLVRIHREVATISALSSFLSHTHTHPFSLQWRDVEEHWNLWRLILTLFYYSPSLASELSRISMGLHSLSWWKDSCAAESLFTPRPQPHGPLEYTTSPFTSMLTSEPSNINQKQTGASHLLISCSLALFETTWWIKKRHFWDWQPT